jgi:catalase
MASSWFHPAPNGTTMTDKQPAPTTTDAGIPVESDEHWLTIGPDGPIGSVKAAK